MEGLAPVLKSVHLDCEMNHKADWGGDVDRYHEVHVGSDSGHKTSEGESSGMERSPLQRDPLKAAGGGGQISDSLGDLDFIPETWDAIERH